MQKAIPVRVDPEPPLANVSDAAPQLPQIGHPCFAQHFRGFNVGVRTKLPDAVAAWTVVKSRLTFATAATTLSRRSAISRERPFPARTLTQFQCGRSLHPFPRTQVRSVRPVALSENLTVLCAFRLKSISERGKAWRARFWNVLARPEVRGKYRYWAFFPAGISPVVSTGEASMSFASSMPATRSRDDTSWACSQSASSANART